MQGTEKPKTVGIADILNRNAKRTKELNLKQMNLASNAPTHKTLKYVKDEYTSE